LVMEKSWKVNVEKWGHPAPRLSQKLAVEMIVVVVLLIWRKPILDFIHFTPNSN